MPNRHIRRLRLARNQRSGQPDTVTLKMPRITLNGADFNYSIAGPEHGRLIILLHGGRGFGMYVKSSDSRHGINILVGDHRSDFRAYQPLAGEYRILGFDFRGHGHSSCTPPYTFKQLVHDIEAFRQHFAGEEKAVIAGGSFGGYLAQQVGSHMSYMIAEADLLIKYAITYPEKVSHLVLRGTAPSHHRKLLS